MSSRIVPSCLRAEWLAEWSAELACLAGSNDPRLSKVLKFVWGSWPDAVTVRRLQPAAAGRLGDGPFGSPSKCLVSLSVLALLASAAWIAGCNPGFSMTDGVFPHLIMICLAIVTSLIHNSVIVARQSITAVHGRQQFLASLFLMCKTTLALAIAGLLTAVVLRPLSSGTIHAHAYLFPYLFAYRWSIQEQAKRCPVCLRRMSNPVQIGTWPTMLLDWFGMEYMCRLGHGVLYEPNIDGAFSSRRWTPLGPSWKDLFADSTLDPRRPPDDCWD